MRPKQPAIVTILFLAITPFVLSEDSSMSGSPKRQSVGEYFLGKYEKKCKAAVDKKARIFYSGRMLGYMRYGVNGLKEEPPPCTLLGMGDNLAPKYEARLGDNEQFKSRNPPISNMPNIFYHCCPGKIA